MSLILQIGFTCFGAQSLNKSSNKAHVASEEPTRAASDTKLAVDNFIGSLEICLFDDIEKLF